MYDVEGGREGGSSCDESKEGKPVSGKQGSHAGRTGEFPPFLPRIVSHPMNKYEHKRDINSCSLMSLVNIVGGSQKRHEYGSAEDEAAEGVVQAARLGPADP